ncbi:MAG: RNA-directed DNA polymerase, partial [Bacteroidetes bacterium]|nr:RNA-directed DNA polymerase [Bacteroidota bacterium]
AKQKLDDNEKKGVIEKVTGPTDWCSAISFVRKPDGKMGSVVDLVQLNKYVKQPTHPFPSPRDIVASIDKNSRCLAVFHAANGYWQIPLSEKSKDLTTFLTEWGRYRYTRAPMGLITVFQNS